MISYADFLCQSPEFALDDESAVEEIVCLAFSG